MYERETSWAPRYVGEELRLARLQVRSSWENDILAHHRAETATDPGAAERHRALARMWQTMHGKATQMADVLAAAQETRRQWEALTESTRRAAIAADLELRRRHPGVRLEPLRSAESGSAGDGKGMAATPDGHVWVQETLDGGVHLADMAAYATGRRDQVPVAANREVPNQLALALRPETVTQPVPEELLRIKDNARKVQEQVDQLRTIPEFAEDDDAAYLGPGWGMLARRDRDAILQPPKPNLIPARAVLQRTGNRAGDREPEAG
jgi:hypothetical protein